MNEENGATRGVVGVAVVDDVVDDDGDDVAAVVIASGAIETENERFEPKNVSFVDVNAVGE